MYIMIKKLGVNMTINYLKCDPMKKIYTDPNQFGQEYLDKMYHILGEDDDIYRREVLLKRKSKL